MRTVHITEKTLRRPYRGFWLAVAACWVVPLIILLATFRWSYPCVWPRLLYKSTWVLFGGALLSWIPTAYAGFSGKEEKLAGILLLSAAVISLFLLPFGLGRWEFYGSRWDSEFGLSTSWHYLDNWLLSFFLHIAPIMGLDELVGGFNTEGPSSNYDYGHPKTSAGLRGERTGSDVVWKGGQISDDFYGRHGEFDRNDRARRISEDIQQFHLSHPDADLSDHYQWEDILDAKSDGYLDENTDR